MSFPPPRAIAPLYSSDNPDVGVLGPMPFEPAPSESRLMQLYRLMAKCRDYLTEEVLTNEQAMPAAQITGEEAFVFNWWVYDFEDNCMELEGISVTDTLFVCRCLLMCCKDPDIRPMSSLYDIHELYVRLQVLGSNHTRAQFERPIEHREVEMLEKRIASLVVFVLCDGTDAVLAQLPGSLPLIDPKLKEQLEALKTVPYIKVVDPSEVQLSEKRILELKEEKAEKLRKENNSSLASEPLIAEELSVNEGLFWHADKKSVVSNFVPFASLILRNYYVDHEIWKQFPERSINDQHFYTKADVAHMKQWFRDKCEFDYADDFVKRFRDMVFDHWLPIGACQIRLRDSATKYDVSNPLNLLEEQLGVDSTTSLASYARERAMHISKDEKHQVYEFLLLSQFSYMMQHMFKTEFTRDYYITPTRIFRWRGRLKELLTYMKPRRPIVLRLKRTWLIHDAGEWITCESLLDALLKWMMLIQNKYAGTLATGVQLTAFIDELTKPKKIEEVY
jgi:hypothetical protein